MSMDGRLSGIENTLSRVMRIERTIIFERIYSRVSAFGSPGDEVHPSISEIRDITRKLLLETADVNLDDLTKVVNELPYEDEKQILKRLLRSLSELSGVER